MKTLLVVALIALTALAACDDDSGPRGIAGGVPFGMQNNEEAALAALWLSDQLTAPYPLYKTIADDLAAIRSAFADSTTMTSIVFRPPWIPSMVGVFLTEDGARRLREGTFTEFDELGVRFCQTSIDTSRLRIGHRFVILKFSGRKHPRVLANAYAALDGVEYADINGYVGDWSCVYPWRIDGGMSYLVRYAWGDCPAGCINSIFWYFRVIDDNVEYVGRYQKWVDDEPDWWSQANDAYHSYRSIPVPAAWENNHRDPE